MREEIKAAHRQSITAGVLAEVGQERIAQDKKWGEQNHTPELYYTILGEEFGEIGKAICERKNGEGTVQAIREELIQTAAVAVAMVEMLDRKERKKTEPAQ